MQTEIKSQHAHKLTIQKQKKKKPTKQPKDNKKKQRWKYMNDHSEEIILKLQ